MQDAIDHPDDTSILCVFLKDADQLLLSEAAEDNGENAFVIVGQTSLSLRDGGLQPIANGHISAALTRRSAGRSANATLCWPQRSTGGCSGSRRSPTDRNEDRRRSGHRAAAQPLGATDVWHRRSRLLALPAIRAAAIAGLLRRCIAQLGVPLAMLSRPDERKDYAPPQILDAFPDLEIELRPCPPNSLGRKVAMRRISRNTTRFH